MMKLLIFALIPASVAYLSLFKRSNEQKENVQKTLDLRWELRKLIGDEANEWEMSNIVKMYSRSGSLWLSPEEVEYCNRTLIQPLKSLKIALIVVDYQNDFISGSLNVTTGDAQQNTLEALPYINSMIQNPGIDRVVYTQDWHPENHISFVNHAKDNDRVLASDYAKKNLQPFDAVQFLQPNVSQTLYPSHCVPGTWGALLSDQMILEKNAIYIHKGSEVLVDSYSAFKNNNGQKLELDDRLKSEGINAVIACGLAYDICVHYTLKDASDLGFLAAVSPECSKGFSKKGISEANETFKRKNVAVLSASQTDLVISRTIVPIEWAYSLAKRANNQQE